MKGNNGYPTNNQSAGNHKIGSNQSITQSRWQLDQKRGGINRQ